MAYITPAQLYERLQKSGLSGLKGKIIFDYSGIKVEVREKSAV